MITFVPDLSFIPEKASLKASSSSFAFSSAFSAASAVVAMKSPFSSSFVAMFVAISRSRGAKASSNALAKSLPSTSRASVMRNVLSYAPFNNPSALAALALSPSTYNANA